jgi:hypothetical protein
MHEIGNLFLSGFIVSYVVPTRFIWGGILGQWEQSTDEICILLVYIPEYKQQLRTMK